MIFKIWHEEEVLYMSWSEKSPKTERDMHLIGGHWDDFNRYRFGFEEMTAKRVIKYAKANGTAEIHPDTIAEVKEIIHRQREAEALTSSDADAEISPALASYSDVIPQKLRPYQRAGIKFLAKNEASLLADDPGTGKAQPLSEPVITPEGWKTMGDIKPGSQVVGPNGKPVNVLKVFPQGKKEIAKVTFSDGTVVRCDWDHLWTTQNKREREITGKHKVLTTREMFEQGVTDQSGRSRFSIPMTDPVEFSEKNFPIDPYTWGVITGDGSVAGTHHSSITTDHEIVENLVLPEGVSAKLFSDKGWWGEYRLNGLSRILREHGLNGTRSEQKFIPDEIRLGSVEQRVSYLQGLLDTDGGTTPSRDGKNSSSIEYGTVSERLAHQVADLVQSLGGNATVRTKETHYTHLGEKRKGQMFYRMNIRLPEGIKPFRLKRKAEKWVPREKYQPQRWVRSIESTGEKEEMQCILVDSDDHLYLTTGYAVTHNTLQTIASMISANVKGDILVLAPSVAANISWPAEIQKWAPKDEAIAVMGPRKKREEALAKLRKKSKADRRWVFCNTEMVRTEYVAKHVDEDGTLHKAKYVHHYPELFYLTKEQKAPREWDAIVVDEAHNSLITTKSQPYDQTLTRRGFSKLHVKPGGKRIAISGTPFRGKPENLWGILNWLNPKGYKSYWRWAERWFIVQKGYFGGVEDMKLRETEKVAFYKAIQPIMIRRTKQEVAPDLPPKMYAGTVPPGIEYDDPSQRSGLVGHWLEMSPKQQRAYEEMETYATAALDNGTLVANGVLSELTRLKQFATSYGKLDMKIDSEGFEVPTFNPSLPSNKFDWLVEFLGELGVDGKSHENARKVVVASQFTSIIDLYSEALEKKIKGLKVLKITGKVSQSDREKAVDLFQNDDSYQILLLNTKAGGVALTLDRADDMVILDETFIPDDQTQVEDRIHRVSRIHNVTIHYVRSLGTIEEKIARKTIDRDNLQKQLLDGARGVDYARHLLGE